MKERSYQPSAGTVTSCMIDPKRWRMQSWAPSGMPVPTTAPHQVFTPALFASTTCPLTFHGATAVPATSWTEPSPAVVPFMYT